MKTKAKVNSYKILLPEVLQPMIMEYYHQNITNYGGHIRVCKTLCKISGHFTWPGKFDDVRKFVRRLSEIQGR